MKTLKLAFAALLVMGISLGTVNAQDAKSGKGTKTTTTKKDAGAASSTSGQHLKKDGTPDMRYKENKDAAAKPAATSGDTKPAATKSKGKSTKAAGSSK